MNYVWRDAKPTDAHSYLWPAVKKIIASHQWPSSPTAFDLGSGNGATSNMLHGLGFSVTGVDPSETGVLHAKSSYPTCRFELGNAYDDLSDQYGQFDLVISLEVVEHVFDPYAYARTFISLMKPGGVGVISTPYHGYWKNLALAAAGQMDRHYGALHVGGHIKFFSMATLGQLLSECGATDIRFSRVGRIPPVAKSMIASFTR